MEVLAPTEKNFLKEGSTRIFNEGYVFYNPVQEFNRDLSISVLSTFSKLFLNEQNAKREKRDKGKGKQNRPEPPNVAVAKEVCDDANELVKDVDDVESEPITVKAGEKLEVIPYKYFVMDVVRINSCLVDFSLVW